MIMAIDPPIKTKITIDPETGARTFNQSWSSELKSKSQVKRKPVTRETFVKEGKEVKPSVKPKATVVKKSGERSLTEVLPLKAAGTTKTEITAPKATPRSTSKREMKKMDINLREGRKKIEVKDWEEKNQGKKYYNPTKQSYQSIEGASDTGKQKNSSACGQGCR
jgi:hypothetical protein